MSEDEDASISRAVFQVFRRTAADGGNRDRERPLRMMAQVLTGEEIDQAILRKRVEENEKTPNKRRKLTDTAKKQMAPRDPYADPRPSTSAAADQEIEEVTVVQETSEEDTESDMEDDERSSSSPEPEVESQSQELAAHNMIKNKKNVIEDSEEETEEEISEHKNKTPRRSKRKIENSDDSKAAPGNSAVVKRKQELQRLSEVRNRKIKATQKRRIEKGGEISSDDECEDLSESVDKVKRSLDFETITHISETDSEKENSQEPLGYGESGDELSSYESDFIDDSDGDEEMEASTVRNNFEEEMRNIISNFDRSNDTFREATERYQQSTDTEAIKKRQAKSFVLYKRLIRGLQPLGSRKGLTPLELLKEFAIFETSVDDSMSESCACGKRNLKNLFFMWNIKVPDIQKRTLYHKTIIGSECINRFYEAQKMQKGAGSIMDYLCRNGMVMFFRKKLKGKKLRFEIEIRGAVPRNIKKTICDEHWTLEVKFPFQVTKTECSEMVEELLVDVHPGTIQDELIQGEKYKVWMRSDIQSHSNQIPYPVKFVITKLERP